MAHSRSPTYGSYPPPPGFKSAIFSLLRVRFFSAAGQFIFPFHLSFLQDLIQCFPTLHNLLWWELLQFIRGILGSTRVMTFMTQGCWNNNIALTLQKDTHAQKAVDIATGSGLKTSLRSVWLHSQCILQLSVLQTVMIHSNLGRKT